MNGIIQRPALSSAQIQRVGDILELRWLSTGRAYRNHAE